MSLLDDSLTDFNFCPPTRNFEERFKIIRNFLDLCGIAAICDIFNLAGGLSLMLFHDTKRQWPSCTFCNASSRQLVAASGLSMDADGPFLMAASSSSIVQSLPQSTGQPCVAY